MLAYLIIRNNKGMSNKKIPFYVEKMNDVFSTKQKKNPKYSLRAYASFLELNPGTLSSIMSGKRSLPESMIDVVSKKIELTDSEYSLFKESILLQNPKEENVVRLDASSTKTLFDEWEYFVILGAIRLKSFDGSYQSISDKTEISLERVIQCIENLQNWGLVGKNMQGHLERSYDSIYTHHDISSDTIRSSHLSALKMAAEKIETVPVLERDYNFTTLTLDSNGFKKLKKKLLKLRGELSELSEDSSNTDEKLYRLSMQLFPLTK